MHRYNRIYQKKISLDDKLLYQGNFLVCMVYRMIPQKRNACNAWQVKQLTEITVIVN